MGTIAEIGEEYGFVIVFSIPICAAIIYFILHEIKYQKEKNKINKLESEKSVYNGIVKEINIIKKSDWEDIYIIQIGEKTIQCLAERYRYNYGGRYNDNSILASNIYGAVGSEVKVIYDGEKYISDINLKRMEEFLVSNRIMMCMLIALEVFLIIVNTLFAKI